MTEQPDTQDAGSAQTYREQIELLQEIMTNQQNRIDELAERVTGLEDLLGERRGADRRDQPEPVDPRRSSEPATAAPKPVDWSATNLTLSQRATLFGELAAFVDDLVSRHNLQDRIRPCWWRHSSAVEELTALWTARQMWVTAASDAGMPSWWQDLLDRSASRLRRIFVKCRKTHEEPKPDWMSHGDRTALEQEIEKQRMAAVTLPPDGVK